MVDRNRIGMAGHSIGGASALAAMTSDRRIRAGVNLDGALQLRRIPQPVLGGATADNPEVRFNQP